MIYHPKKKNLESTHVDTRHITSLMNNIASQKTQSKLDDDRLKTLHNRLNSVIDSFNETYKELVRSEIKILNLNIAAEAIKERNDFVNQIYEVVITETNHKIS